MVNGSSGKKNRKQTNRIDNTILVHHRFHPSNHLSQILSQTAGGFKILSQMQSHVTVLGHLYHANANGVVLLGELGQDTGYLQMSGYWHKSRKMG